VEKGTEGKAKERQGKGEKGEGEWKLREEFASLAIDAADGHSNDARHQRKLGNYGHPLCCYISVSLTRLHAS